MKNKSPRIIPVILCGGGGTRLWPLSDSKNPKQFHTVIGNHSMFHNTLDRAVQCSNSNPSDIITVTADHLKEKTSHALNQYDSKASKHLLSEPMARNTAAAIAYATLYAQNHFSLDSILWILPADHHIDDITGLEFNLREAVEVAQQGYITTFGMSPSRPETGYGYIKTGDKIENTKHTHNVHRFVEKPNKELAQEYIEEGSYVWNSGMFVASVRTILDNFIEHAPETLSPLHHDFKENGMVSYDTYNALAAVPFDVAIMEKTDKAAVTPCSIGWSDVGTWESIWKLKQKDENGNVAMGDVETIDTKDCLIKSENQMIAAIGLENLAIIEHNGKILIADKNNSDAIKKLTSILKDKEDSTVVHLRPEVA